jgi:lia operon protein LiaG
MKNYTYASLFALLLLASTTWATAQNVLVNTTKKYPNITQIEVESGWLDVSYVGGSSTEVAVEAYLASNVTDQDIVFVTVGDVLKINYKSVTGKYNWNNKNKGYIKITGPVALALQVRGTSGEISIQNLESKLTTLQLTSGNVAATQIKGDLTLTATSGNLQAKDVEGDLNARLTSGNTTLEGIKGTVNYGSTSGNFTAKNIGSQLDVQLTSGNAKLENVKELGATKITSGNLTAVNAGLGPKTQFNGTSGNFTVQTPSNLGDFNYALKAASGNLRVGNTTKEKALDINNNAATTVKGNVTSGNITITN